MGGATATQTAPRSPHLSARLLRVVPAAYVVAVIAVAITRATTGEPTTKSFALTPDRLAQGKIWLFLTSALIVNGPALVQILGLAPTLAAADRRLGSRFTSGLMIGTHVGATLLAYAALAVFTGDADGAHNHQFDYGISAVWMGALGALWVLALTNVRSRDRLALAMAVLGAAAFIFSVVAFPLLASTEHGLAFVLGAAGAALLLRARR